MQSNHVCDVILHVTFALGRMTLVAAALLSVTYQPLFFLQRHQFADFVIPVMCYM